VARLILVRHGEAAAGWGADADPGLIDEGHRQAVESAATLGPLGPLPIVVSPLRRTRETAGALEERWGVAARVEPRVGEVRSPDDADLEGRAVWLRGFMGGTWSAADARLRAWRQDVLDALLAVEEDTVVVTHFIAINAAVGAATGDDRVVSFAPANCSHTVVETDATTLRMVELGDQGMSVVR
jgi:broad specificity phosphatase PhoE